MTNRAFSSEGLPPDLDPGVGAGSREENASKQKLKLGSDCIRTKSAHEAITEWGGE
jgi:hypothetical protein